MEHNLKTVHQYIGPIFLSDSLFGTLIAENFRYLTDVGLHDAITIIYVFDIHFCSQYVLVAAYALSQQWFSNLLKKRRKKNNQKEKKGRKEQKTKDKHKHQSWSQQPYKAI